jgi:hypothetical protein
MKIRIDSEHLLPSDECILCKNKKFTQILDNDRYLMNIKTQYCDFCSFVFTNPYPSSEWLSDFYENHYWRVYFQGKPSLSRINRTKEVERAESHLVFLDKNLFANNKFNFRLIDVGGGNGTFIKFLNENSSTNIFDTILVEKSNLEREFAVSQSSAGTYMTDLSEVSSAKNLTLMEEQKNLFTMIHVFEHIGDPNAFLKSVRNKMSLEDYIYIDVPDVMRYDHITDIHIAHKWHFSLTTLTGLLEKHGFLVVVGQNHNPPRHPESVRVLAKKVDLASSDLNYRVSENSKDRELIYGQFEEIKKSIPEWFSIRARSRRLMKKLVYGGEY